VVTDASKQDARIRVSLDAVDVAAGWMTFSPA
jgi:hypothetical protein